MSSWNNSYWDITTELISGGEDEYKPVTGGGEKLTIVPISEMADVIKLFDVLIF